MSMHSNSTDPFNRPAPTCGDRESRLLNVVVERVVRPSFQRCCAHGNHFFDTFYDRLSAKAPEIGPMFAGVDMSRQNALVRDGIEHLIAHAQGSVPAQQELRRLATLHGRGGIGVRPELYPLWIDALMEAVHEHDEQADEYVELAWRETILSGVVLVASQY